MNKKDQPSLSVHTTLTDYLNHYSNLTPSSEALVCEQQRFTYAQLSAKVSLCAKALMAKGINKGDRVAVLSTCRVEYWVTFLATTSIGAIWLGLNPKYKLQEISYVLEDAKPKLLFAMAELEGHSYVDNIAAVQTSFVFIEAVIAISGRLPDSCSFDEFLALGDVIEDEALAERRSVINTLDPALLVYTSGSTGRPKGALLSHYGLCFGATVQNTHLLVETPITLCNFPINHVACIADTCCVNLIAGGTLVFQERFDPTLVLRAIQQERISLLSGVPTMLLMLVEHPDFQSTDMSSLELIVWGGAALPVPTIERLKNISPRLMNVYGMTETAANTTYTTFGAGLTELSETIGKPSLYMPCRIFNKEGKSCGVGEAGELQFKGDYLLLEYLNCPEANRDVYTKDGWLHTGDLGYWREDGTITLVGRMSDMFKSGGYNVYPREIENLLESHPAVEIAAVVSVPDKKFQEVGAAFTVLSGNRSDVDIESLKAFCNERLANYKVPKTINIVTELPVLSVGKVDKVTLKKYALSVLTEPV